MGRMVSQSAGAPSMAGRSATGGTCRAPRIDAHRGRRTVARSRMTLPSALAMLVRNLMIVAFVLTMFAAAFFVTRGYNLYREALDAKSLDDMAASIQANPEFAPVDQIADLYLQAVVAVEDRRFYAHPGFDVIATGRALANDLRAGSIVEGGSTITQQLAKNQYFTQEQTIERKIAEVFMALTIEQHFSKREILELYVNSIYFRDGYEGIGRASEGYFGKRPHELTDGECAMLAGIPNAPSIYTPTANPDLAQQRQRQVIRKLVSSNYLDASRASFILSQAA